MSVFHREDVGWWRSWLQQSYQAVKEKVSRASALPPAGAPALPASSWVRPVLPAVGRSEADLGTGNRLVGYQLQ